MRRGVGWTGREEARTRARSIPRESVRARRVARRDVEFARRGTSTAGPAVEGSGTSSLRSRPGNTLTRLVMDFHPMVSAYQCNILYERRSPTCATKRNRTRSENAPSLHKEILIPRICIALVLRWESRRWSHWVISRSRGLFRETRSYIRRRVPKMFLVDRPSADHPPCSSIYLGQMVELSLSEQWYTSLKYY